MNNLEKLELLKLVTKETNIHFHSFDQEVDTLIAKNHFLLFELTNDTIIVSNRYSLPGPKLKKFLRNNFPFELEYSVDNFQQILLDTLDDLYGKCIALEYQDEL